MINKIVAAAAAAMLLASGAASAQTGKAAHQVPAAPASFANSYYNQDYWRAINPSVFAASTRDPLAGTVWDGWLPY